MPTGANRYDSAWLLGNEASVRLADINLPNNFGNIFDPCVFDKPYIHVGWERFGDGRGVVIVTGAKFAAHSGLQLTYGECTSAFSEKDVIQTNACGEFTKWHVCTCSGPPISVTAVDRSGNLASGTVQPNC
jgi:hypothetical protein